MRTKGLLLSAFLTTILSWPAAADDMIVNGLHCNSICQNWMGVNKAGDHAREAQTAAEAAPQHSAALVDPPAAPVPPAHGLQQRYELEPPPRRVTYSEPRTVVVDRGPITEPAEPARQRTAALPPPPPLVQRAALQPEPYVPPQMLSRSEAPDNAITDRSIDDTIEAPDDATTRRRTSSPSRTRRSASATADPAMEPGLKNIPKLSSLVAVRGAIVVDTPEDQAARKRQMAVLLKATSRPHLSMGEAPAKTEQPKADLQGANN